MIVESIGKEIERRRCKLYLRLYMSRSSHAAEPQGTGQRMHDLATNDQISVTYGGANPNKSNSAWSRSELCGGGVR